MRTSTKLACIWFLFASSAFGQHCPIERGQVKLLADAQGAEVANAQPEDAKISDLVKIAPPSKAMLSRANTRFTAELHRYRVPALVIGYKLEADYDFHIVLADPDNPSITMIAEIPAGKCMAPTYRKQFSQAQARFAKEFSQPTAKFNRLPKPIRITANGVLFFDVLHGQTGVAPNGAELHPLFGWEKQQPQPLKQVAGMHLAQ